MGGRRDDSSGVSTRRAFENLPIDNIVAGCHSSDPHQTDRKPPKRYIEVWIKRGTYSGTAH
eukprot:1418042-Amphidinium_carterae.1